MSTSVVHGARLAGEPIFGTAVPTRWRSGRPSDRGRPKASPAKTGLLWRSFPPRPLRFGDDPVPHPLVQPPGQHRFQQRTGIAITEAAHREFGQSRRLGYVTEARVPRTPEPTAPPTAAAPQSREPAPKRDRATGSRPRCTPANFSRNVGRARRPLSPPRNFSIRKSGTHHLSRPPVMRPFPTNNPGYVATLVCRAA